MSKIEVYQIVDFVSEKVAHTFYAPNEGFARRSFGNFLDGLKGRIVASDFGLFCVGCVDNVPETFSEALKYNSKERPFLNGADCLRYLDGGDSDEA